MIKGAVKYFIEGYANGKASKSLLNAICKENHISPMKLKKSIITSVLENSAKQVILVIVKIDAIPLEINFEISRNR